MFFERDVNRSNVGYASLNEHMVFRFSQFFSKNVLRWSIIESAVRREIFAVVVVVSIDRIINFLLPSNCFKLYRCSYLVADFSSKAVLF